jgi:hypothetical protein
MTKASFNLPADEFETPLATVPAHAFGDFRAGDDLGLRNSQQVDDARSIRRRYVAEHAQPADTVLSL